MSHVSLVSLTCVIQQYFLITYRSIIDLQVNHATIHRVRKQLIDILYSNNNGIILQSNVFIVRLKLFL